MSVRRTFLVVFLVTSALLTALVGAEPSAFNGHWEGKIEIPATPLKIAIDLAPVADSWTGTIDIPQQNAKDLPLGQIAIDGQKISFRIAGVPGQPTFEGTLSESGKDIAGDFSQAGQRFPFRIERKVDRAGQARKALQGFEEFLIKAMEDWKGVGMGLGIVVGDEVIVSKGFGLRNKEENLPVTENTLFAIGSTSKAFTTFAMGLLVDQGRLDMDKPVQDYLPGWQLYDKSASARITPRDLVTHRSGLPRHDLVWYNNLDLSRRELFQRLRYLQPNKDLRESFQYNNIMYVMAGHLVGTLRDQTWEEAVGEMILAPLGMTSTNFSVADSQKSADFAIPYQVEDEKIERMSFRDISNVGPAGSINSSVKDMLQWARVHLNGGKAAGRQIIKEATLRDMHTPHMAISALPTQSEVSPASYGLGWFLASYQGHYRVAHGGNIDGFSALVTLFPNDEVGIVALTNQNGSALPNLATRHAVDRILGLELRNWNAEALKRNKQGRKFLKEAEKKKETVRVKDTRPTYPLADYAGQYRHPGYGIVDVESKDQQLSITFNNIATPFEHWHYDVFNGLENPEDRTFEDAKVQFRVNLKGDIEGLSTLVEPNVDPIFFTRMAESRLSDPDYLARFVGAYQLGPQRMEVILKGHLLTMVLPGQPTWELEPYRDDEFNFKALKGFSVQFREDESGKLTAVVKQPNGVFTAKRIAEE